MRQAIMRREKDEKEEEEGKKEVVVVEKNKVIKVGIRRSDCVLSLYVPLCLSPQYPSILSLLLSLSLIPKSLSITNPLTYYGI